MTELVRELSVGAANGVQVLADLLCRELGAKVGALHGVVLAVGLARVPDTLIVDTAAGINESVASFARAATDVLVVVCDEPASITDAYALVKTLSRHHGINEFRILANQVRSAAQGREAFEKLSRVVHRFLDVSLLYEGFVPEDELLRRAVQKQRPVVQAYPRCRASLAFRRLALRVSDWTVPSSARGHVSFFVERGVNEVDALENVG